MRLSVATSSLYFAFRSYTDPNAVYNNHSPKLSAYVSFVQWMLMFEFFKLSKTLSATAFVGLRMTTMALRFVVVLILWLEAMGVAILHLIEKDGLLCSKYPNSPHECEKNVFPGRGFDMAYKMFASSVGHENEVLFYSAKSGALVRTLFAGALWVAIVIILNILVASMVSAYAQAEAHAQDLAVRARAVLVLQAESNMSMRTRWKHYQRQGFDKPLPFSEFDFGLPGGVTVEIPSIYLEQNPSYMKALDRVLRFGGTTDPNAAWPVHSVSSADDLVNIASLRGTVSSLSTSFAADVLKMKSDVKELKFAISEALGVTSVASGESGDHVSMPSEGAKEQQEMVLVL